MFSMEICLFPERGGGGADMRERKKNQETHSLLSSLVIDYEGCG